MNELSSNLLVKAYERYSYSYTDIRSLLWSNQGDITSWSASPLVDTKAGADYLEGLHAAEDFINENKQSRD